MTEKTIAIIPAKGNSRRVPGKNTRLFNGRPLISYTIEAALQCPFISEVYVSTDSSEVAAHAKKAGAHVPFLRVAEQSLDYIHSSVPVIDMLEKFGGKDYCGYCVMLLPTYPIRKPQTIGAIIGLAQRAQKNVLSVGALNITVHHLKTLTEQGTLRHIMEEKRQNFQIQDAQSLFVQLGYAQCAPVERLIKERSFQYGEPLGYEIDRFEAIDIDTEEDFAFAEKAHRLMQEAQFYE